MPSRQAAVETVIKALQARHFEVTSEPDRKPEQLRPGHPVYEAVVALERLYPRNVLPARGRLLWKRLLQLSRQGDASAFEAADEFIEWLERAAAGEDGEGSSPAPEKDGPFHPYGFRWQGGEHDVPPRDWYLLKCVWKQKRTSLEKVIEVAWGENAEPSESAIKSALCRLNRILARAGVPWQYGRRGGFIVEK